MAEFRIDQVTPGAGTAGQSRHDLVAGEVITLTATDPAPGAGVTFTWEIIDAVGSTAALSSTTGTSVTIGNAGLIVALCGFDIQLTADDNGTVTTTRRIASVRSTALGIRHALFSETAPASGTLTTHTADSSTDNAVYADRAGRGSSEQNWRGWSEWAYEVVEALEQVGGASAGTLQSTYENGNDVVTATADGVLAFSRGASAGIGNSLLTLTDADLQVGRTAPMVLLSDSNTIGAGTPDTLRVSRTATGGRALRLQVLAAGDTVLSTGLSTPSTTALLFGDGDLVLGGSSMYGTEKLHVLGDTRISGAAVITGNLTVQGTTTTIDSTVVDIADRVIHVNATTGVVAVPTSITGLSVHRGATAGPTDRDHAALLWTGDSSVVDPSAGTGYWTFSAQTGGDDSTVGTALNVQVRALLLPETSDQATAANQGALYTKDNGGSTELYYRYQSSGSVVQLTGGVGGGTLDAAYDYGGAGAGRAITADSGAVAISNAAGDATNALELSRTVGTGAALLVSAGQILGPNGAVGTPTFGFSSDPGNGFYLYGADSVGITAGGAIRATVSTTGLAMYSGITMAPVGEPAASVAGADSQSLTFMGYTVGPALRTFVVLNEADAGTDTYRLRFNRNDTAAMMSIDEVGKLTIYNYAAINTTEYRQAYINALLAGVASYSIITTSVTMAVDSTTSFTRTTDIAGSSAAIELYHNRATPGNGDSAGVILFSAKESAGSKISVAAWEAIVLDAVIGTGIDTAVDFYLYHNGTYGLVQRAASNLGEVSLTSYQTAANAATYAAYSYSPSTAYGTGQYIFAFYNSNYALDAFKLDGAGVMTLTGNTDVAATAPVLDIYHVRANPADADTAGIIRFSAKSEPVTSAKFTVAEIRGIAADVTGTTEDGRLDFYTIGAGTLRAAFSVYSTDGITASVGIGTSPVFSMETASPSVTIPYLIITQRIQSATSLIMMGDSGASSPTFTIAASGVYTATYGNDGVTGPTLELRHVRSDNGVNNDEAGSIDFWTDDNGGAATQFGELTVVATSATATAEYGAFDLKVMDNGTLTTAVRVHTDGGLGGIISNSSAAGTSPALRLRATASYTAAQPVVYIENADGAYLPFVFFGQGDFSITSAAATSPGAEQRFTATKTGVADDILGILRWSGKDGAANAQNYVYVQGTVLSPTNGAERGRLDIGGQASDGTGSADNRWVSIYGLNDAATETGAVFRNYTAAATDGTSPQFTFVLVEDSATLGPVLSLYRNRATPALNDEIGCLQFDGDNGIGGGVAKAVYGQFLMAITDYSTNDSAQFYWRTNRGAGLVNSMRLDNDGGLHVDADVGTGDDPVALFDDFDDALVLRDDVFPETGRRSQQSLDRLCDMGIFTKKRGERGYWAGVQPMLALIGGAAYQNRRQIDELKSQIDTLRRKIEELESA